MIRKPSESDIDEILRVLSCYNFKVLEAVDGSAIDDDYEEFISLYNQVSEINLQNGFLAIVEGKIVGFSHYKLLDDDVAKTTLISVLPECQGLGLGEKLQIARMKEAYDKGCKKLITFCDTSRAVNWYIKHFNYKILRTEFNHHRLHFFPFKDRVIWGVHYGFKGQKLLQVLECDLKNYFKK